jgi:DNA-binding response OmpR family regulator
MAERVLLVEDDEKLGQQVCRWLRDAGYEVRWLTRGDEALVTPPQAYGVIVLDLMLPGTHGLDVLKKWREEFDVPVLILSAGNETIDKVRALRLGGDDYVTKPFWPDELIARVKARIRRPGLNRHHAHVLETGDIRVDLDGRQVWSGDSLVELTRVEFDLLAALARRPGSAITRVWLVENVLDPAREGADRTLDVHIFRLRRKLGLRGQRIKTVWGVGYRLIAPP